MARSSTGRAKHMMERMHDMPRLGAAGAAVTAVSGILLASCFTASCRAFRGSSPLRCRGLYQFLLNKWYFDELYDAIFVQPPRRLARAPLASGRHAASSTACRTARPRLAAGTARGAVRLQSGRVANYAFAMIIGLVALRHDLPDGPLRR